MNSLLQNGKFPLVVTAYTVNSHIGTYYKRAVLRLFKSCHRFDLRLITFPLHGINDWVTGCSFKTAVLEEVLCRFGQPVLWLDADAEIFQYPEIFEDADFDIGICQAGGGHWLTGTLYLKPTALGFVRQWREQSKPPAVDEIVFRNLYNNSHHGLKLRILPDSYNCVVDTKTDTSKLVIGQHFRPDVAACRGVEHIPPPEL